MTGRGARGKGCVQSGVADHADRLNIRMIVRIGSGVKGSSAALNASLPAITPCIMALKLSWVVLVAVPRKLLIYAHAVVPTQKPFTCIAAVPERGRVVRPS